MTAKGLTELRIAEVPIGKPLAWTLFDQDGNIVFRPGFIFRDRDELLAGAAATPLFRADPEAAITDIGAGEINKQAATPEMSESETTLDEIGLHIGETWQLQPLSDFDPSRYYVNLVGYMKGVSVLVTTPTVDNKSLLIREHQPYIVRAFSGKSVYAFKTSVIKSIGWPFPYLHLAYPETVSGIIVRTAQRVDVKIIAAVTPLSPAHEKTSGLIRNVSKNGASLQARSPIGAAGDQVELAFKLTVEGYEHLLSIDSIIRAVRPVPHDANATVETFEFGVQFIDLKPVPRLVLSAFVNSWLAKADAN